MKQPSTLLADGTRVRTHATLDDTRGMMVSPVHLGARVADTDGEIAGVVGGHGGDVYWVKHPGDGPLATYCFTEFELDDRPREDRVMSATQLNLVDAPAGHALASQKPWLVGESNPHQRPGADPDHKFDLYPLPRGASGDRLCRLVLGMQMTDYLRSFVRRDLLAGKWSVPAARKAGEALWKESGIAPLVLLGAKVSAALGLAYRPFTSMEHGSAAGLRTVVILPHPSGLCRAWHEPGAFLRARAMVKALLPSAAPTASQSVEGA